MWTTIVVLGGGLLVALALQGRQERPAPPLRFSHHIHTAIVKCEGCHALARTGFAAGTPSLADCMDCHEGDQARTAEGKQEEAKLRGYARAKGEIPWVRVTALARDSFFSHRRHVAIARVECATCHGDIARTTSLPPAPLVPLTMNMCMDCHRQRGASQDCLACHR